MAATTQAHHTRHQHIDSPWATMMHRRAMGQPMLDLSSLGINASTHLGRPMSDLSSQGTASAHLGQPMSDLASLGTNAPTHLGRPMSDLSSQGTASARSPEGWQPGEQGGRCMG
eukprot:1162009-Pelagomonas_calceolata.AAC.6